MRGEEERGWRERGKKKRRGRREERMRVEKGNGGIRMESGELR